MAQHIHIHLGRKTQDTPGLRQSCKEMREMMQYLDRYISKVEERNSEFLRKAEVLSKAEMAQYSRCCDRMDEAWRLLGQVYSKIKQAAGE